MFQVLKFLVHKCCWPLNSGIYLLTILVFKLHIFKVLLFIEFEARYVIKIAHFSIIHQEYLKREYQLSGLEVLSHY
jgi:hypothetical protein